jgi:fatty-acyl-CoA synthase
MLSIGMTMMEALREVADSRRGQGAVMCGESCITYGELLERVDVLARGLRGLGVRKGDKVAALLPPSLEFVTLFFAVAHLGAVNIPLDPRMRRRRLSSVLLEAEPVVLVASRPVEGEVRRQIAGLRHVILAADLAELVSTGGEARPLADVSPEDLLILLYTSGTTGTPKGTMHTHRSLIAPVVASIKLRESWIRRPGLKMLGQTARALVRYRERLLRAAGRPQTFLSTVGWHTITGLEILLQALLMGDRLVVMPRFHPREALELIEREQVTVLIAVPMAYHVMLGLQGFERYDTSSLLICGTGAAPCPPHLAREIQSRVCCAVPMPRMQIKIVDEQRRELPPGQVGELACRSDSVMLGYYRAPQATSEVKDDQGWYYSGDLALMDDEGYLRIVGRKKDVIIRGGQNVYPAEIEAYLTAHPKIREAAVVGVPSAIGGENVWAFVILEDGARMTGREILDYCRAELEPHNIPNRVRFVTEFPCSTTGKPQKFKLRTEALQEARR